MGLPLGMGRILDLATTASTTGGADAMTQLPTVAGALSAVLLVGLAANVIHDRLHIMIGERIAARLRDDTFRALLKQDIAFFDASRSGDLVSRMTADTTLVGRMLSDNISNGFHDLALSLGGTAILVVTCPKLAMVALGVIPPVAIGAVVYGDYTEKISDAVQAKIGEVSAVESERLSNVRTDRWFASEYKEAQRHQDAVDQVLSLARKRSLANATFYGGVDLAVKMSTLAVLGYGG